MNTLKETPAMRSPKNNFHSISPNKQSINFHIQSCMEAHINAVMPPHSMPTTIAHEQAHRQQTLNTYKKGYPTKDHSGTLTFEIIDICPIENQSYWVMGKYSLSRKVGDANGIFMVIFKKIAGEWKIVADMSCG